MTGAETEEEIILPTTELTIAGVGNAAEAPAAETEAEVLAAAKTEAGTLAEAETEAEAPAEAETEAEMTPSATGLAIAGKEAETEAGTETEGKATVIPDLPGIGETEPKKLFSPDTKAAAGGLALQNIATF